MTKDTEPKKYQLPASHQHKTHVLQMPSAPSQPKPFPPRPAKTLKPIKVKVMWDWANTQLYKFLADEHFRDLLRRNIVKLNEGEKRPATTEYLKKIKPEERP